MNPEECAASACHLAVRPLATRPVPYVVWLQADSLSSQTLTESGGRYAWSSLSQDPQGLEWERTKGSC